MTCIGSLLLLASSMPVGYTCTRKKRSDGVLQENPGRRAITSKRAEQIRMGPTL